MGDGQHGGAQPAEEPPQFDHEAFAQGTVELSERLVQHQQSRAGRQRAGERDALLLAAGQGGDRAALGAGEADEVQQFRDPPLRLLTGRLVHARPEGDVAADVAGGEELVVLEHQPHSAPVRGDAPLVASVEPHAPGVRFPQAGDGPQQRGLAASGGAEHADDLVFGDVEVHRVQGRAVAEAHGDRLQSQCRHLYSSPDRSVRTFSNASRTAAHTSIRMVLSAIAWP